ncbi:MAG: Holliday junction branch migration protein RuvA [Dehalococcoidia bacterium]|nr:Holliday junction branch migration protein RuvA [Dehalococcoidia bacterium]
MIASLDGIIDLKAPGHVVINVGGIGFLVYVSATTFDGVGEVGERAVVQTHFVMRDDAPVLFGFASSEELSLFQQLISVNGVGPRVALALLGSFKPEDLAAAILRGDTTLIARVQGVGKKTAARLCVELESKMEPFIGTGSGPLREGDGELVAALTALGYTLREATEAAHTIAASEGGALEERLRLALRALASR